MQAKDVMTAPVITSTPFTAEIDFAALLLDERISHSARRPTGGHRQACRTGAGDSAMYGPLPRPPSRFRRLARCPPYWTLALAGTLAEGAAAATATSRSIEPQVGLSAMVQHGLYVMLIASAAIFIAVLSAMLGSIIRRRSSQRAALPGSQESMTTQIAWAGVPYVMVIVIAFLAMRVASA